MTTTEPEPISRASAFDWLREHDAQIVRDALAGVEPAIHLNAALILHKAGRDTARLEGKIRGALIAYKAYLEGKQE